MARKRESRKKKVWRELKALALLCIGCLLPASLYLDDHGALHALVKSLFQLFGYPLLTLGIACWWAAVRAAGDVRSESGKWTWVWWLLFMLDASALCSALRIDGTVTAGGRIGMYLHHYLSALTSPLSSILLLCFGLAATAMLALELPLSEITSSSIRLLKALAYPVLLLHRVVYSVLAGIHRVVAILLNDLFLVSSFVLSFIERRMHQVGRTITHLTQLGGFARAGTKAGAGSPATGADTSSAPPAEAAAPAPSPESDPQVKSRSPSLAALPPPGGEGKEAPPAPSSAGPSIPCIVPAGGEPGEGAAEAGPEAEDEYSIPRELVFVEEHSKVEADPRELLEEKGEKLINTLAQFNIEAKIVRIVQGPTITQYQIKPASGIRLSRITALAGNIAMALATPSVRIEAPIPGKSAVGIEIPNETPTPVLFRDMIESDEFLSSRAELPFVLGKSISGRNVVADLARMPHLLVAGATGSGKSVCINTLIASLLFEAPPTRLKFLMIDPKMVELTVYNGIPHLVCEVVTSPEEAAGALKWATIEMERRYRVLSAFGVRNIRSFNEAAAEGSFDPEALEKAGLSEQPEPLPYLVVIIDELADLMMTASKEVETTICRLAQMARAVGIHLVIATQRPSTNVITGVIKANFPSRIAFAVSSKIDSKVILDCTGAETLLGRGDMLYLPVGDPKPTRIQGAFVSDDEIHRLVEYLKNDASMAGEYVDIMAELQREEAAAVEGGGGSSAPADKLWRASLEFAVANGEISTSLLQRHLKIGYNRAARIVDAMYERGIISAPDGARRRKVLITAEQLEEYV